MEVIDYIPYIRTGDPECQPRAAQGSVWIPAMSTHARPDAERVEVPAPAAGPVPPSDAAMVPGGAADTVGAGPGGVADASSVAGGSGPAGDEVPPPPPETEEMEEIRLRDLRAEAKSTKALLTHKPFNQYCPG